MRTLLVEDEVGPRQLLERELRALGHDVTAVTDGEAALVAHLRSRFELLVVDWVMPRLDGLALCQRVRSLPAGDEPFILVVTGRDRPADLADVLDSGADDYLAKPIDQQLLRTRVRIATRRIEQARAHRAARRELELTRLAMDHGREPMLWLRPDGTIRYVNHAACTLLGYSREQMLSHSIGDLEPRLEESDWARMRDELAAAEAATTIAQWVTADGSTVPVELTAGAVDFEGEPVLVMFARDLSERQKIQARLMKADRLASLGSLAAGVAHEINNPLAYVIANLDLMREGLTRRDRGESTPSYAELLRMTIDVADGADRVRRIVSDLRSFARSNEEQLGPVKIRDVLDTAVDIAANEIRHRAQLVRRYRDVPPVLADEGRLAQVFLNLLVNAAQAIPETGAGHRIAVTTDLDDEGLVVVEVSDTGVGIDPSVVDHVFDPFFTTKGVGEGTGLGLSICHGIVTSLGGAIEVHSQPGAGARFRVRLPTATAAPLEVSPEPEQVRSSPRQLRILVVDDEPLVCDGIRRALLGHEIVVADTGREAIRRCASDDFDLVLCDVMMPDVSGMEVYGRVRSERPEFEGRFVFMTGGAFTPKAAAFLASVSSEQLTKPFTVRDLRELVHRRAAG